MNPCLNCGADVGDGNPQASHCGKCPPWRCAECGEMDSSARPCRCWVSLDGMTLADIKALFAAGAPELSIDPRVGGTPNG